MVSIGPQLPPHLQKRKRTPEDDADPGSPPHKTSRRGDTDEIPLDDDMEDDFRPRVPGPSRTEKTPQRPSPAIGPTLPPTIENDDTAAPVSKKHPIGPSLPTTAPPANSDEIPLDSDSDDAAGPAPPQPSIGPAPPPKRVLGPAPPPAPLSERPPTGPSSDANSSDDDDDWGPALPGASATNNSQASASASARARPSAELAAAAAPPKRDDWMLAPPTSSGYRAADPTKLKARKFASGPRAATEAKTGGIGSMWTETPEEKARRLANAVLGREDPNNPQSRSQQQSSAGARPDPGSGSGSGGSGSRADEARVKAYVEQTRGRSLVAEHQAARAAGKAATLVKGDEARWGKKGGGDAEDEEDDPSKRAFDWEKDMKVGGRISHSQRKELLNRAANFGGRFQSGKYL